MAGNALAPTQGKQLTRAQSAQKGFDQLVRAHSKRIKQVAASSVDPSRLYRLFLSQISQSPQLQQCTSNSLLLAMQQAAEVGLEPGTALQLSYLVPYKDTCQFIIGYRGYLELFRRSGLGLSVQAQVVYDGDDFDVVLGLDPIIKHVPKFKTRDPKDILYAYAIAVYKDGSKQFEVLTRQELDATRERSASGRSDKSPWATDFAAMCKKTAIRRLAKLLPMAINIHRAVSYDERNDEVIDIAFEPESSVGEEITTPFDDLTESAEGSLPGMSEANPA